MNSPVIILAFAFDRSGESGGYLRALASEKHAIEAALRPAERAGLCRIVAVPDVTVEALCRVFDLYNDEIAGFHFAGHAGPVQLQFNTAEGALVDALSDGIAQRLGEMRALRFVCLNGCSTAGQRTALAHHCPDVALITTTNAIRDDVARDFAEQFYQALGVGATVASAFERAEARIRTTRAGEREWCRPPSEPRMLAAHGAGPQSPPWRLDGALRAQSWRLPAPPVASPLHLGTLPDHLLGGQYRLEEAIGRGNLGTVYRAWDVLVDRPVAIKLISLMQGSEAARRLRREARMQARLRHPCVVRLLTFGEDPGGLSYLVQEYVPGRSIAALVKAEGPVAPTRAVAWAVELLDALDEAHANGVVHQGIKPENLMLIDTRQGEAIRILDFGLARLHSANNSLSASGDELIEPPRFISPEQAQQLPPEPRSDIYSVGCVLYFALTGQPPYVGSMLDVLLQHAYSPPPSLPASIPPALCAAVERAMAKAPGERFASASEMRAALIGLGDLSLPVAAADERARGDDEATTPDPAGRVWQPISLSGIRSVGEPTAPRASVERAAGGMAEDEATAPSLANDEATSDGRWLQYGPATFEALTRVALEAGGEAGAPREGVEAPPVAEEGEGVEAKAGEPGGEAAAKASGRGSGSLVLALAVVAVGSAVMFTFCERPAATVDAGVDGRGVVGEVRDGGRDRAAVADAGVQAAGDGARARPDGVGSGDGGAF